MNEIRSLDDLRWGDIVFTNISGLFPGVFPVKAGQLFIGERVRIGPLSIDHVAVVTQPSRRKRHPENPDVVISTYPLMVQAMPGGAEEVPMTTERYWKPDVAFLRLPEMYPRQGQDVAHIARLFVEHKVAYSFGSYVMLGLHERGIHSRRLEARIARKREPITTEFPSNGAMGSRQLPVEAICSVLADQCWTLTGKEVMQDTALQVVTPGKLFMRYWTDKSVVWGGAGMP